MKNTLIAVAALAACASASAETISLKSPKRTDHEALLKDIQQIDGILFAKEL